MNEGNSDKIILHLCADTGSDSWPYRENGYEVICVGKDIGVENYHPPKNVYGIIANPVCTEFSIAQGFHKQKDYGKGMFLVKECQRIISECNPVFWVIENPATGKLKEFLGTPAMTYEPWHFGSPWTKKTALWGNFNMPEKKFNKWEDVPKIKELKTYQGRQKPSLAKLHRAAIKYIPEFSSFAEKILSIPSKNHHGDMEFRSLCSQNFAQAFYQANQ